MTSIKTFEEELLQMRPSFEIYSRVDESILADKELFKIENQALHGTLAGDGMIEVYEVYKKKDEEEILCLIKLGQKLNGYPDIVHGGITALLFDNTFGWVFIALKAPHGVTANLSINYRKPVMANSWVLLTAKMDRIEGRKLYMSAKMQDESGNILADSTTLFIAPKSKLANDEVSQPAL